MHVVVAVVVFGVTAGCSSATTTAGTSGNRRVLLASEIATIPGTTAYDAIMRLRPEFLRTRGADSPSNPLPMTPEIYVDDMHLGGIETLRTLRAEQIARVEYLGASDATTRFGTGHTAGVILIKTR